VVIEKLKGMGGIYDVPPEVIKERLNLSKKRMAHTDTSKKVLKV